MRIQTKQILLRAATAAAVACTAAVILLPSVAGALSWPSAAGPASTASPQRASPRSATATTTSRPPGSG